MTGTSNKTKIQTIQKLSQLKLDLPNCVFIYDKNLLKTSAKKWIQSCPISLGVVAGEELKSIQSFEKVLIQVFKLASHIELSRLTFVSVGGGSVGDFVGFLASVYKRGAGLVHVPSTWLAAVDSAHGGKTALNIQSYKNQIGTFYPAQKIFLVEELLKSQPSERIFEAYPEFFKIALIEGGALWKKVSQLQKMDHSVLWKLLPAAIQAKYKVVAKDPFEKTGLRAHLNLGHTLGHVFESVQKTPHGIAVGQGLQWAIHLSYQQGILSAEKFREIVFSTGYQFLPQVQFEEKIASSIFMKTLLKDKKMTSASEVYFIFVTAPGKTLRKKIATQELTDFYKDTFLD